jgi:hypothetical protein
MRARSFLGKSAVLSWSVALVGVYFYQRSGGQLIPMSAHESQAPVVPKEFVPAPKPASVGANAVTTRDAGNGTTSDASAASSSPKNPPTKPTSQMLLPGPKSGDIF